MPLPRPWCLFHGPLFFMTFLAIISSQSTASLRLPTSSLDNTSPTLGYYTNCEGTVQAGTWTVKDYMWGIGYGVLSCVTFLGNVVNVLVFVSSQMPSSAFNTLLLSLAVAEGLEGGMFFTELTIATYGSVDCNQKALKAMAQVGDLATYCASWFTALISVIRCIAVTAPINYKKLCTVRNTHIAVGSCVAVLAVMETATWINVFVYRFDPDLRILEPVRQTVGRFLPICIALAATVATVLRLSCRKVDMTARHNDDDVMVIRMLIVLLSVFFVTNGYAALSIILQSTSDINFESKPALLWTVPLAFGINSSCNIFLYFFMTPRYRKVLAYYINKLTKMCKRNVVGPPTESLILHTSHFGSSQGIEPPHGAMTNMDVQEVYSFKE